jgi:hypothetical protein
LESFLCEHLSHSARCVVDPSPVERSSCAPGERLLIQVIDAREPTSREEVGSNVSNSAFGPPLFVPASDSDRPWFETAVSGVLRKLGIEANCISRSLKYDTFQVVIETHTSNSSEPPKGKLMSVQKSAEILGEKKP